MGADLKPGYVHGSGGAAEAQRLERQAAFFSPLFHPHLPAEPGQRGLDLDGTARDPALFQGAVAGLFEGLDESLGPQRLPAIRRAAAALRALPGGELHFRGYFALGTRT